MQTHRTVRSTFALITGLCAGLALIAASPRAYAGSGFIETGFGLGKMTNLESFFGSGAPAATGYGLAFDFAIFASLFGNATQIQLGLINKMINAGEGSSTYTLNVPYPELRIQLSRLFFGVGYTPYVMGSSTGSIETLAAVTGAKAMVFDAGILFPIVPIFSMAAYGSMTSVTGAGTGPSATEFGVILRFYFTVSQAQGGSSSEFKGWRYPFGREIW